MGNVTLKAKAQRIAMIDRQGYIARPVRYSTVKGDDVVAYASQSTNVPEANVRAALMGIREAIAYYVVNGHTVNLGKFGKLRPIAKCQSVVSPDLVNANLVKGFKVKYKPSRQLQELVNNVKLSTIVK